MFYALTWSVVFGLLALWSLASWVFHSITAWVVSNAGVLVAGSGSIEGLRLPDWLVPWVSPELTSALDSMASALAPAIETLLGWAPALQGGLSIAVWFVWGLGSILIVVLGFLVSGLIATLRRRAIGGRSPGLTTKVPG
ncbi:MAG: hypothetical protein Q7T97_11035 [Burkholderiaceae bacterium]|nr:hypothetical protein [Burkholderiaceae bacterium]